MNTPVTVIALRIDDPSASSAVRCGEWALCRSPLIAVQRFVSLEPILLHRRSLVAVRIAAAIFGAHRGAGAAIRGRQSIEAFVPHAASSEAPTRSQNSTDSWWRRR